MNTCWLPKLAVRPLDSPRFSRLTPLEGGQYSSSILRFAYSYPYHLLRTMARRDKVYTSTGAKRLKGWRSALRLPTRSEAGRIRLDIFARGILFPFTATAGLILCK